MKEIRGVEAVRYSRELNIFFDIDEDFLTKAEGKLRGSRTSMADVDELIEEQTGRSFDPAEIVPGKEAFDFLINRYGDGWIYIAQEGKDPEAVERIALRLFRRRLDEQEYGSACDVKELLGRYGRTRFGDTGFPREADLNLLFHAALRLVEKGILESVTDDDPLPDGQSPSYGRRRFVVTPDVEVSLVNVLCERCLGARSTDSMRLHRVCAQRLKKALTKATACVRSSSG
jgi:hypothetical protein